MTVCLCNTSQSPSIFALLLGYPSHVYATLFARYQSLFVQQRLALSALLSSRRITRAEHVPSASAIPSVLFEQAPVFVSLQFRSGALGSYRAFSV